MSAVHVLKVVLLIIFVIQNNHSLDIQFGIKIPKANASDSSIYAASIEPITLTLYWSSITFQCILNPNPKLELDTIYLCYTNSTSMTICNDKTTHSNIYGLQISNPSDDWFEIEQIIINYNSHNFIFEYFCFNIQSTQTDSRMSQNINPNVCQSATYSGYDRIVIDTQDSSSAHLLFQFNENIILNDSPSMTDNLEAFINTSVSSIPDNNCIQYYQVYYYFYGSCEKYIHFTESDAYWRYVWFLGDEYPKIMMLNGVLIKSNGDEQDIDICYDEGLDDYEIQQSLVDVISHVFNPFAWIFFFFCEILHSY